jgi:nicotinate-nucleotide pyrophosphorylase (carboxylating)
MDLYTQPEVTALLALALGEDLRQTGDLTANALIPDTATLAGTVTAKSPGVVCGLALFARVAALLGGDLHCRDAAPDGTVVAAGTPVLRLHGDARLMLAVERTALNLCQRLSGTATMTRRYVDLVAGTRAGIFDTRKTAPGQRLLQKHAVAAGGGRNHRMGLHDQVLIKDNHLALMPGWDHGKAGSAPAEAVRRCRAALGASTVIEVEIETVADLPAVMRAGADIVLLDNLPPAALRDAVALRDRVLAEADPAARGALRPHVDLEASGGITLATVRAYADTGVERISTGEPTHSAPALDLSLRCAPA